MVSLSDHTICFNVISFFKKKIRETGISEQKEQGHYIISMEQLEHNILDIFQ